MANPVHIIEKNNMIDCVTFTNRVIIQRIIYQVTWIRCESLDQNKTDKHAFLYKSVPMAHDIKL